MLAYYLFQVYHEYRHLRFPIWIILRHHVHQLLPIRPEILQSKCNEMYCQSRLITKIEYPAGPKAVTPVLSPIMWRYSQTWVNRSVLQYLWQMYDVFRYNETDANNWCHRINKKKLQLMDPTHDTSSMVIGLSNGVSFDISFGRAGETQPNIQSCKHCIIINHFY